MATTRTVKKTVTKRTKPTGSIRVHALASELGLASQALVDVARRLGIDVTRGLSTVTDEQAARIRQAVKGRIKIPPSAPKAGKKKAEIPPSEPRAEPKAGKKKAGKKKAGKKKAGKKKAQRVEEQALVIRDVPRRRGNPRYTEACIRFIKGLSLR